MVEQYQAEINRLDRLIDDGIKEESRLRAAANDWKSDADGMKIRKYGKDNQTDLADRERKYRIFEDLIRQANRKADEIATWRGLREKQMTMKSNAAVTENDVSKVLANQGYTRDTLMVKEKSLADVTIMKGTEEAGNIAKMGDVNVKAAEVAVKSSEIDNQSKQNQVILISAAGAIVVIIIGILVWKKYKPTKKK